MRDMIYMGSDHGGFELKENLKTWLLEKGNQVEDMGAEAKDEGDDFVDYAMEVAEALVENQEAKGIVLCRNGVGVSVVANRYGGVRCALGFDQHQVEKARSDDDINCLSLPADYLDLAKAKELVEAFLKTKFDGGEKYVRRLIKLESIETGGCGGCSNGGCGGGGCGNC